MPRLRRHNCAWRSYFGSGIRPARRYPAPRCRRASSRPRCRNRPRGTAPRRPLRRCRPTRPHCSGLPKSWRLRRPRRRCLPDRAGRGSCLCKAGIWCRRPDSFRRKRTSRSVSATRTQGICVRCRLRLYPATGRIFSLHLPLPWEARIVGLLPAAFPRIWSSSFRRR